MLILRNLLRLAVVLTLFLPGSVAQANKQTPTPFQDIRPEILLPVERPVFPDMTANWMETVEKPRIAAEEAARLADVARLEAQRAAVEAERVREAELASIPAPTTYTAPRAAAVRSSGGLVGSYGWASSFGNCVDEPGINNPGYGNPSAWPATSRNPWIGATALWYSNHTGRVVGQHPDGSLEIAHRNWQGYPQTRFPLSTFRGFR